MRAGQRVFLAGFAAVFRCFQVDGAPPVPDLVTRRGVGASASTGAATSGCPEPGGPLAGGAGLGTCAGQKGGELAGPSPVDRGRPGSKMHILSDAAGLPLRVALSAANTHDSLALKPMLAHFHMKHRTHAADSMPTRLHADKAYDVLHLRRWLWGRHIGVTGAGTPVRWLCSTQSRPMIGQTASAGPGTRSWRGRASPNYR